MTTYTFYNVKKKAKVDIEEEDLKKTTYTNSKTGRISYAIRAVDDDGTNLTKFMKQEDYEALDVPVV